MPEEEDADVLHEVIMALEMKDNGTVGCAYYVALDEALFLQEDIPMAGMELIETLLIHVEPTTVIIANRAPESLRDFLEAGMQDVHGSNQGKISSFLLAKVTKFQSQVKCVVFGSCAP